jgi:hypothetical protein
MKRVIPFREISRLGDKALFSWFRCWILTYMSDTQKWGSIAKVTYFLEECTVMLGTAVIDNRQI